MGATKKPWENVSEPRQTSTVAITASRKQYRTASQQSPITIRDCCQIRTAPITPRRPGEQLLICVSDFSAHHLSGNQILCFYEFGGQESELSNRESVQEYLTPRLCRDAARFGISARQQLKMCKAWRGSSLAVEDIWMGRDLKCADEQKTRIARFK